MGKPDARHDELRQNARDAIAAVAGDQAVGWEQTRESLEELADIIDGSLACLAEEHDP